MEVRDHFRFLTLWGCYRLPPSSMRWYTQPSGCLLVVPRLQLVFKEHLQIQGPFCRYRNCLPGTIACTSAITFWASLKKTYKIPCTKYFLAGLQSCLYVCQSPGIRTTPLACDYHHEETCCPFPLVHVRIVCLGLGSDPWAGYDVKLEIRLNGGIIWSVLLSDRWGSWSI